jgi:DNA helicase-2/ATP-dependent DNA helicase PcrA
MAIMPTPSSKPPDPDEILGDLNPEQRAAVTNVRGPLAIMAGAGSGKTRVLSRRAAYAAATGQVDPERMLIVTFTDKAAGEMERRIRKLGLRGAMARTVHSFARLQLSWLWPRIHDRAPLPALLTSKYGIVAGELRRLRARVEPADVVAEIEWAKQSAITPAAYLDSLGLRIPGVDPSLAATVYRAYEERKRAMSRLDFDDLLLETTRILAEHPDLARLVRARRNWISVDEYQDTNLLQQCLFDAWLGDEVRDFCVVGDPDQAIFGFAGASPRYLTGFERRFPGAQVLDLSRNYRSSPQIIAAANRMFVAAGRSKRLVPTEPEGEQPRLTEYITGEAEVRGIVERIRELHAKLAYPEIAILVRLRAHLLPFEQALSEAGIPYRSIEPFFDRTEVRMAIDALHAPAEGEGLLEVARRTWERLFGIDLGEGGGNGDARRESLTALLTIAAELAAQEPAAGADELHRLLGERAAEEATGREGVELLTYHRAKGLEWAAVFLPRLEDGTLPDFRSIEGEARAEEWRLLYVGVTRARRHLEISWARRRTGANGKARPVTASAFVEPLHPPPPPRPKPRPATTLPSPPRGRKSPIMTEAKPKPAVPSSAKRIDPSRLLPKGTIVYHRSHGRGRVTSLSRAILRVAFDDGHLRQFMWPKVAKDGNLLRA